MRSAMGLALLWLTSTALAADSADYQFNFVVKMGDDGKPVALHDALPSASTHRLPVTDIPAAGSRPRYAGSTTTAVP